MITRMTTVVYSLVVLAISVAAPGEDPPDGKPITRVVEGRVVDERGSPVTGATVLLRPTEPLPKGGTAQTNADGRYHIEWDQPDQADLEVQLMVLAPDFAYALVPAPSGKAAADIKLKAEAWKTTEIRLADPVGRPAAGVELTCSSPGLFGHFSRRMPRARVAWGWQSAFPFILTPNRRAPGQLI